MKADNRHTRIKSGNAVAADFTNTCSVSVPAPAGNERGWESASAVE